MMTEVRSFLKRLAGRVAQVELILLALAAPFLLFPNRWTALAFGLIVLTWLCRVIAFGRFSVPTGMDAPLALLTLMAAVGFWISADPDMSRAKFWGIVLQVALFYGVANGLRTAKGLLWMAGLLLMVTLGAALLSLVGTDWASVRLIDLPWLYDRLPNLVRGLPGSGVPVATDLFNPRHVGATMAMLLPVALALLFFGRGRWLRLLSAGTLVFAGVTLLLSQALQAILGLALALLLLLAWRSRWFLLAIPLGLLAAAAGVLAYGPSRAALALLSWDHPLGIAVVLRLDIWSRAWAMVRDMPFTGVGLNTFPVIQTHFYPGFLLGPESHAHNVFLQTAVDLGLPGLWALLWLLVAFAVTARRAYLTTADRNLRALLVGLAGGVLAFVGYGLVDAVTLGAKPAGALFVMLGLAPAILAVERTRASAQGPAEPRESLHRAIGQVAVPLASLVILLLAVALAAPATPWLNLGAIRAHQLLVNARATGSVSSEDLDAALGPLRRAATRDQANVYLSDLLGSLFAWQGDYEAALGALQRRVMLEPENPMARYAPWIPWQRQLQGQGPGSRWDDLLWVYQNWQTRYPDRAEGYVRSAIVWQEYKGDPGHAQQVLEMGLKNGAKPQGLLTYYRSQLE
jgi:putative inorganic carbon (HCO3(-)) transporter